MTTFRNVCLAGALAVGIGGGVSAVQADSLTPDVKAQVASSVASWHANGDTTAFSTSIADLCSENPGIALDVVAYAGEVAASSGSPERCLVSDLKCTTLEDLLALLYAQAIQVNSVTHTASVGRIVLPPPPLSGGGGSGGSTGGDGNTGGTGDNGGGDNANMPPPCQTSGPCGGEPPPASLSSL